MMMTSYFTECRLSGCTVYPQMCPRLTIYNRRAMTDSDNAQSRTKLQRIAGWRPSGKQVAVGAGLVGLVALGVITKGAIFEGAEPLSALSGWTGTSNDDDDDDRKPPRSPDPPDDASLVYL